MAKVGLFYGSNTGKTEMVAYQMRDEFERQAPGTVEVFNIGSSSPEDMLKYQYIICGIPTWNTGQLQDDWEFFLPRLAGVDLNGRRIAIFGLGDQNGYGFNFLDAVGMLADALMERGGDVYGLWKTTGYEFEESKAKVEDHFLGLGIDEDGQSGLTPARIQQWVKQVRTEWAL
jgi:flavodoxin I